MGDFSDFGVTNTRTLTVTVTVTVTAMRFVEALFLREVCLASINKKIDCHKQNLISSEN